MPSKMTKRYTLSLLIGWLMLVPAVLLGQHAGLEAALDQIEGLTYSPMAKRGHFEAIYHLTLTQPLDHQAPEKGHFIQHLFLSHVGADRPMVYETEGYSADDGNPNEVSKLFKANQLRVEYRYYGHSIPAPREWEYLTNRQAVEDLHRIRELFAQIYPQQWISTGISKGGETCLIYRRYYPEDVVASIPYVAPLILGVEDPRTDAHIATIGTKKCRKKIAELQKKALQLKAEILPFLTAYGKNKGFHLSDGEEVIWEYMVLEYPFSFWQWGGNCEGIPGKKATAGGVFRHISKLVSPYYYTDEGVAFFEPSFYQHLKELGYYGFPKEHLKKWLTAVPNPSNAFFAPEQVDLSYDSTFIPDVLDWLDEHGNNILYVYGELDTWTACAVTPSAQTNAIKMVCQGGDHRTRIKNLSVNQKKQVFDTLETWLNVKVDRSL